MKPELLGCCIVGEIEAPMVKCRHTCYSSYQLTFHHWCEPDLLNPLDRDSVIQSHLSGECEYSIRPIA